MRLPSGLQAVHGEDGAAAFATPEVEAWVRGAIERGEQLHEVATRQSDKVLQGRGPVPVLTTPRGQWVVRRYHRGGMIAAPLLGDRYLRIGLPRPMREARASDEVRRRGIPTPRVMAGAVYPAGAFYRADLVTEFVAGAVDLAYLLFEEQRSRRERSDVLREVGRLLARTAAAGVEHADLNAKNVLVEQRKGGALPLFLDLDRCRVFPPGIRVDPRAMLTRLCHSLRKHEGRSTRPLAAEEWSVLSGSTNARDEG
ncbi:MAG: 3-deoxy-D-manno-octulosonic acid kinase [Gemmatimonadetes bacterium]|nr:3-deoxy-D-manno-octulosonic acid kinase [Gemmatimonadota bacterium]